MTAIDDVTPATPASDPIRQRFVAAVDAASARYVELGDWTAVVDHVRGHAEVVAIAPSLARAEPTLQQRFVDGGVTVVIPDGDDPASEVADVPVGLVRGEMAIAETGSVLVAEHELGDRVVTMLCHRLVQVVAAGDIAPRLEDAAAWLAQRGGAPGFASLMTGPSRTADIERSLTIGVQGPDEVDVVVLVAAEEGRS